MPTKKLSTKQDSGTTYWLVVMEGDIEPDLRGPFASDDERGEAAKKHRRSDPNMEDGLYPLNVTDGKPCMGSYSGRFFDE